MNQTSETVFRASSLSAGQHPTQRASERSEEEDACGTVKREPDPGRTGPAIGFSCIPARARASHLRPLSDPLCSTHSCVSRQSWL